MDPKADLPHAAPSRETTPATGLAATPGDYGFPVGAPLGRYVVLERLGGGGMGVVYSAYDPKLDRRVALKLLRPDVGALGDAQQKLLREGQALARLAHPNVVNVHDIGEFDGRVFVDMEFVKGSTLTKWLDARPRSWREIIGVFVQAGRGLAAAHAVGIVHRDFKPDNVLVGDDGRVRVADFGIAQLARSEATGPPSSTRSAAPAGKTDDPVVTDNAVSVVQGTLLYMAPEQLRGRAADARSDQFSFCVALAEALLGQHPFATAPPEAIRAGELPALARSSRIPLWVRPLLLRGLRPDADGRYPSMDALLAALSRDPTAGWTRALRAGGVIVLLGLLGLGYARLRQQRDLGCRDGAERLKPVWDEGRSDQLSRAFAATGKPFAAVAWQGARAAIDDYARTWARTYEDACEATNVRGEQSADLLDRRMACLNDRKKDLGALVDVFSHADAPVVTSALSAAQALPSLAPCSDVKALRARIAPPDPATAVRVAATRQEVADVRAMYHAGKARESAPRADALVAEADRVGYLPLEAEVLLLDGEVRDRIGDYEGADAVLFRAARVADASGDDEARVDAYCKLIDVVGLREAKHDIVPVLRDQAEAAIARAGGYEAGQARVDQSVAGVLLGEGKPDEALAANNRALATWEKIRGHESREVARTLGNIGVVEEALGDVDRALASYQEALAIETKLLGPDHPEVVTEWHNIANIHQAKLEFKESAEGFEKAVAIAEASLGPDHPLLAECLDGLANAISELGEYDRATALHERALAIKDKTLKPDNPQLLYTLDGLGETLLKQSHPDPERAIVVLERALALPSTGFDDDTAAVEFALARALAMAGRDKPRARELATKARATLRKNAALPAEKQILAELEAWLAKH